MKKTYIIPATEISPCEAFHILEDSPATTTINPGGDGQAPITDGGAGGSTEMDFINRTNLWDEE